MVISKKASTFLNEVDEDTSKSILNNELDSALVNLGQKVDQELRNELTVLKVDVCNGIRIMYS